MAKEPHIGPILVKAGRFLLVFAVLTALADDARAQRKGGAVMAPVLINDVQAGNALPVNTEPMRDVLTREVQFMAKVGDLTPEQADSLLRAGEKAIERRGGQVVVNAGGEVLHLAPRRVAVVNGRAVSLDEARGTIARRELAPPLKTISRAAWEKFDAERAQLEARRKRAAVFVSIAELDEALLLSREQRIKLCELLTTRGDAWWSSVVAKSPLARTDPALEALIAAGNLGGFAVPNGELAAILRPAQFAYYEELQGTVSEELVIVQQVARPPGMAPPAGVPPPAVVAPQPQAGAAAPPAPMPAAPPGMAPAPRRPAALGFAQAGDVVLGRQALRRAVVRRGPPLEQQQRRLNDHLTRLIEDLAVNCGLTESQCAKLALAGKLDVEALRQRGPAAQKLPDGQEMFFQVVQVAAASSHLPVAIFDAPDSAYKKALRNRLFDEQRQKLAAVERERRQFQQQALVEMVVVGFERSAALTSAQCEALSAALRDLLADSLDDSTAKWATTNWRADSLRRISQLPAESLRPYFFDFQWPAAQRQQAQLAEAARRLEAQAAENAAVLRGISGAVKDRDGKAGLIFQADEMRLNVQ